MFDGPLHKDFATEYGKLITHANDLETAQKGLVEHWASKVAQTDKGSLPHVLALSEEAAESYTFESYPDDHAEVIAYWLLYYVRMCSSDAHSQSLSDTLNGLFDLSNVKASNSSVLKTLKDALQKVLGFVKSILKGGSEHSKMLAPAINVVFTLYGTQVVKAAMPGKNNATKQITDLIYQSQKTAYADKEALKEAFENLMKQEGYGDITFPEKAEQLGKNIHGTQQMTPEVTGSKAIGLVEFHAQIDLSLDDAYLDNARKGNNFDLATDGIGLVAAGLSLYTTVNTWNDTRRNASTIGHIVSNPTTQLTAAFADAYASVHGIAAAVVGRGNAAATNTVLTRVFGSNAALSSVVASNSGTALKGAAVIKSLGPSARIAGGVGIAISVGLAIEGYKREDKSMMVGNGLMAVAGVGLLVASGGLLIGVLLAMMIAGFVISLFAYADADLWVLKEFWGHRMNIGRVIVRRKLKFR